MELLLSCFPRRNDIVTFHIKNSKGHTKMVKIGATTIKSKSLTIMANPYVNCNKYAVRESKSGGIVLEQSTDGCIELNITPDAKIQAQIDEPENFILVSYSKRTQCGKYVNDTVYIQIGG